MFQLLAGTDPGVLVRGGIPFNDSMMGPAGRLFLGLSPKQTTQTLNKIINMALLLKWMVLYYLFRGYH
jgi:hypothetical protein